MALKPAEPGRPGTVGEVPHGALKRLDRRVKQILGRQAAVFAGSACRRAPPSRGDLSGLVPEHEALPPPSPETAPTVTATLTDGPLESGSIEVEMVEGRPPKTIDVPAADGSSCRYCLADWVQSGPSAAYTFLYRV